MKTQRSSPASHGFTLIELLAVLVLAAVLLAIGAPSFLAYQRNSELTSATNSLVGGLYAGRGEAMKRGMYAMVVPNADEDWTTGWKVFVDVDRTQTLSDDDIVIQEHAALPVYIAASGGGTAGETPAYVMFDASGYAKTKSAGFGALTLTIARTDVPSADADIQKRRIVIAKTGRVRTCKPASDSTCIADAEE
jgi:type IV fimbrial biogenesis protein FimT